MLRKLRIAVSIASAIACGLLVPLWAGSYRQGSLIQAVIGGRLAGISSQNGRLWISAGPPPFRTFGRVWVRSGQLFQILNPSDPFWRFHVVSLADFSLIVPHWFLVVVFGTIGIALSVSWPIRFSLRTMLIVTAILSVSLSLLLALASAHHKGYVVQQIRLKQGRIQYTIAGPACTDLRQLRTLDWFGFGWQGMWGGVIITVPVWFIVLCGATLAAIAWLRWRERLGVRTLSIATAIGVVELGLVAWAIY